MRDTSDKVYLDVDKLTKTMQEENALFDFEDIETYALNNREDVAPVIHAKWIPQFVSTRGLTDIFSCSYCNKSTYTHKKKAHCPFHYCQNCGAKMQP